LPEEFRESIVEPVDKKNDKTYCNNFRGVSLFVNNKQNFIQHPAVNVNSILEEVAEDYQCRFRRNRSNTDNVFCIPQITEIKWEYSDAGISYLSISRNVYDSVKTVKVQVKLSHYRPGVAQRVPGSYGSQIT